MKLAGGKLKNIGLSLYAILFGKRWILTAYLHNIYLPYLMTYKVHFFFTKNIF